MIDLSAGVGLAVSGMWGAPEARFSAAWRPVPAFEVQAAWSAVAKDLGAQTDATEEMSRYIWFDGVERLAGAGQLTVGVYPLAARTRGWTTSAGLRVGGALIARDHASFFDGEALWVEPGGAPAPGWVVAAVGEVCRGHLGARLRLERVTWVEPDVPWEPRVFLTPGVEGFVRW